MPVLELVNIVRTGPHAKNQEGTALSQLDALFTEYREYFENPANQTLINAIEMARSRRKCKFDDLVFRFPLAGMLIGLLAVPLMFFRLWWFGKRYDKKLGTDASFLFFALSKNNLSALTYFNECLSGKAEVSYLQMAPNYFAANSRTVIPVRGLTHLLATTCVYLRWSLGSYSKIFGTFLRSRVNWFHYYEAAFAYLLLDRYLSALAKGPVLGVSNDHRPLTIALRKAFQDNHLPVFYVQHAHVSPIFPPLRFDCAFLDGDESSSIYREINTRYGIPFPDNICLTGNLKIVGHTAPMRQPDLSGSRPLRIGVALGINAKEKIELLFRGLETLNRTNSISVILRQHPRSPVSDYLWCQQRFQLSLEFSDSRTEGEALFAGRIDVIIGGSSSILFDAVNLGIPAFYASVLDEPVFLDYYGFVKRGLVADYKSPTDLTDAIAYKLFASANYPDTVRRFNFNYLKSKQEIFEQIKRQLLALAERSEL